MKEEKKALGYWKIFRELFWASYKALLIVAIISALRFGYFLNQSKLSQGFLDSFGGAFLMHIMGVVIFLPFIAIFALIIGTPVVLFLLKKGWCHHYIFIVSGALVSLIFFNLINISGDKDSISTEAFISGNFDFLLGGGLTGFLLFRQLRKLTE